jgi:hypothetical protein
VRDLEGVKGTVVNRRSRRRCDNETLAAHLLDSEDQPSILQ